MPLDPEKASARAIPSGRRFGPYVLQDLVGAGGMGEVYRARDTRLDRDVAVKMLSSDFSSDPERLTRLAREARVLASLNHPHIAAIYEFEEADGVSGLVLELVEGQTLADRLRDGAMREGVALSIADQIAGALQAAHENGIIHRDLKPGNIKITPQGTVKVLDFGLAKALETATAADVGVTTRSALGATRAGVVLGTPAYMSPEQARGEPVDERTDIWAFGVVVYEMLTGRRPFGGNSTTDTLAAILKEEPDWSRVPDRAGRLLRACLEKDPGRRLRAIADARLLLDDVPNQARSRVALPWLWPAVAVLAVMLALAALLIPSRATVPDSPVMRFQVAAPPGLTTDAPVVSPDGQSVAFVTPPREASAPSVLWLHSLETGQSRRLFEPQQTMFGLPWWSPDSRWLAFVADGKLMKIDVATGAQHALADRPGPIPITTGAWNQDGVMLLGGRDGLKRVSAEGGSPEPVTRVDEARGEVGHFLPVFLPDGRRFLYLRASPSTDASGIYAGSLDQPEVQDVRRVVATRSGPLYMPAAADRPGFLFFSRGSTLLAQTLDPVKLEVTGEPLHVADRVASFGVPGPRYDHASVSGTGVLAYRQQEFVHATLTWVDRGGRELGPLVPEPLANPGNLRFSPDGRKLALTVDGDVWVYDLAGKPPVKLTTDRVADTLAWTPDGSRLVYETPSRLLSIAAEGAGDTPKVVSPPGHYHPAGWSAAGDLIACFDSATDWDIVVFPGGQQGARSPIVQTRFTEGLLGAAVSPDRRWLAYTSNATGQTEVWVRAIAGPGKAERISPSGGTDPVWSKDGRELFYISARQMMSVRVTPGATLDFAKPVTLFDSPYLHRSLVALAYDVTSDGRFLMMKRAVTTTSPSTFHVVVNWKPDRAP